MTGLLLESALRSLALGAAVGLGLWISRAHSARVKTAAWALALAGSLLMPFLMRWRTVEIVPPRHMVERAPLVLHTLRAAASLPSMAVPVAPRTDWRRIAFASWAGVAALLALRVITAFLLTLRLWRRARPAPELSATGLSIRETAALASPATFGSGILLPADWRNWDATKLRAVLAHEQAHVRWGDFWVQLLAGIHAAVFWFSPLAWWLRNRVAVLAEAASDDAALQVVEDSAGYAEILLYFAARPQRFSAAVAMARPRTLANRVDRILTGVPRQVRAGWRTYAFTAVSIAATAALAAGCSVRAQSSSTTTWSRNDSKGGDRWVIVSGDSVNMSGSTEDAERARGYRDRVHGDYIWFSRDGKTYLITDPAAVKRAKALFAPMEVLGEKQAQLGEMQAKLGEQQALLGDRQSGVKVKMPDMDREMRAVREQMERLQKQFREDQAHALADSDSELRKLEKELHEAKDQELSQERLSELQERLSDAQSKLSGDFEEHMGELQSRIGDIQSRFGEVQNEAGKQQDILGEQQSKLGEEQSKLGEQQSKLGDEQSGLAEEAERQLQKMFSDALRGGLAQPVH
jgi:hypothetical protein